MMPMGGGNAAGSSCNDGAMARPMLGDDGGPVREQAVGKYSTSDINGRMVQTQIPEGLKEGMQFQIQM